MKICDSCACRFESADWRCPRCGHAPGASEDAIVFASAPQHSPPGFKAEYFDGLERLEATNFWFRARTRLILWALDSHFPHARSFVDVGCGDGLVLSGIRRHRPQVALAGTEPFAEGLHVARRRVPDVALFQADARRLPFEEEYDVAGAFDVLEHIDTDERALQQIFRAVRPGGGLIVTVPQHRVLWSALDDYSCHQRRYSRSELVGKVEGAGFRVVKVTSFVSFLLPAMLLSRVRQRRDVDPMMEFRIPTPIDRLFERLIDLERICIRWGVSFPAGGSLLLIAKRD